MLVRERLHVTLLVGAQHRHGKYDGSSHIMVIISQYLLEHRAMTLRPSIILKKNQNVLWF